MARRIIGELIESGELSERAKNIRFNDGILYEHNHQPYIKLVDAIEKDGKGCAIHATGTGKMYLAAKLLNDNSDKPFVYIAPTNVILNQFVDTLVDIYFDKKQAEKIKKLALEDEIKYLKQELGFDLHLYTYAKIHRMSTEEMEKVNAEIIVLDEFHRCGADKWSKSIRDFLHINSKAKVMGLSATPIRPSDGKNMVEEMFDGKIASELTLADALEQGILPLPIMVNAMYSFEDEIVSLESQLANKKYDPEKKKEIDKKLKDVKQLIGQSGGVKAIFSDFVEELTRNKGRQDIKMVVFCKDIADRDRKMDECRNWFPRGTKIKKYSVTSKESEKLVELEDDIDESSKSKKLRQKVIETFEQDNSKGVKLLFAVDMLNEGLHVKNLDGVIMLRDTSSNIIFLQQLGRALAVDRDRTTPPLVFDLVNNIEVLGEDIEEYREIIHRLTKNKGYQHRELHQHDFEIQTQIINTIQYLKDISYTFEDRVAPLIAYYKEFGTIANIVTGGENKTQYEFNGKVYNLGNLIKTLRVDNKKCKLDEKEIKLLESMGMVWDKTITFEQRIAPLKAYYEEFGTIANVGVLQTYEFNGKVCNIGNLISLLRDEKKNGKLDEKEIKLLESMGMVWDKTITFEKRIAPLKAYYEEFGTIANIGFNETYEFNGKVCKIRGLIDGLRQGKKKGKLDETQIKLLESMGMVWDKTKSFEDRIAPLIAYYKEFGTIADIIISGKNTMQYEINGEVYRIGSLINALRGEKKKGKLDEKEIKLLESMGMVWDKTKSFEDRIAPLIAYYKEFGTIADIKWGEMYEINGQPYNMGSLINKLRNNKKNGKLDDKEIKLLESMGMVWDKTKSFEDRIAPLIAYYKEFGTIANIVTGGENKTQYEFNGRVCNMGNLITSLRQDNRKGKLDEKEIKTLENIGMIWKQQNRTKKSAPTPSGENFGQ